MSPLPHGRGGAVTGFQDHESDAAVGEVSGGREADGSGTDDGDGQVVELGGHERSSCLVDGGAAAFEEDDVAPPVCLGCVPADAFADADGAEPDGVVQGEADLHRSSPINDESVTGA
jgi:hypothetical protein